MVRDYGSLLAAWDHLEQFRGYQDTQGLKAQAEAKRSYETLRNRMSFELFEDTNDWAEAEKRASLDLDAIARESSEWAPAASAVKEDIIARLAADRGKSGIRRIVSYYVVPITVFVSVCAWLGMWWYEQVPLTDPINSPKGLIERAQAYDKSRNYVDLQAGRGGIIKTIVISPWKPSEAEMAAAQDFVLIGMQGYSKLETTHKACNLTAPIENQLLADDSLEFLDKLSDALQARDMDWNRGVGTAVLGKIEKLQGCI